MSSEQQPLLLPSQNEGQTVPQGFLLTRPIRINVRQFRPVSASLIRSAVQKFIRAVQGSWGRLSSLTAWSSRQFISDCLHRSDLLLLVRLGADLHSRVEFPQTEQCMNPLDSGGLTHPLSETALHLAAREGCLPAVEFLVNVGAFLDSRDSWGWTPLFWAVRSGDLDIAEALLKGRTAVDPNARGADVNARGGNGESALMVASVLGRKDMVGLLLKTNSGWNVALNLQNREGETALFLAGANRFPEVVRRLLRRGADPNVPLNAGDESVLLRVCDRVSHANLRVRHESQRQDFPTVTVGTLGSELGDFLPKTSFLLCGCGCGWEGKQHEIVRDLIAGGADLERREGGRLRSVLMKAVCVGPLRLVRLILNQLNHPATLVNAADADGETALMLACRQSRPEMVEELLTDGRGADINAISHHGLNALTALLEGPDSCNWLLHPKMCACTHFPRRVSSKTAQQKLSIMKKLIHKQVQALPVHHTHETALVKAARFEHPDLLDYLLKNTALGTAEWIETPAPTGSEEGYTPALTAARWGNLSTLQVLLEAASQLQIHPLNARVQGYTALTLAASRGHAPLVDFLLKPQRLRSQVDAQTETGETALVLASRHGETAVVDLLLKANANVLLSNPTGRTALMEACVWGHLQTVQRLLKQQGLAQAQVEAADNTGARALHFCADTELFVLLRTSERQMEYHGILLEIADTLLCKGAQVDARDAEGRTALVRACRGGHVFMVSWLLDRNADASVADNRGETALIVAARFGRSEVVDLLLSRISSANLAATVETAREMATVGFVTLRLDSASESPSHGQGTFQQLQERAFLQTIESLDRFLSSSVQTD
uniref:Uncharacterized protein n=1 Tax=Chromera velia CCMP2878 TaxID=1169474 RepID=A0A0G4H682_9ALVE|eukprot:Cvel_24783.t1-p1 / transcript=Cvel_24783.t1 / gene=Cvel_24783 / organism=Chromera_velia_CCMP2878 / gene_product=Ankyrin-3, putative / transcript_product=Ankyrin-3, putative / location=Cvel_scaffold2726:10141-13486(-) / protein_length=837 / sequence_SO=supercontig / SO=protein_coding / is_pseudo=false